jgi:hypothetical protein
MSRGRITKTCRRHDSPESSYHRHGKQSLAVRVYTMAGIRSRLVVESVSAEREQAFEPSCCRKEQEVEVWLLAGHRQRLDLGWQEVRAEVSVKERIFAPFLAAHGDSRRAGGGRDLLMKETLGSYGAQLQLCLELAGAGCGLFDPLMPS